MNTMKAGVGEMEMRLEQWGAKFDEFVVLAEQAGTVAEGDLRERICGLESKYQAAQAKLEELTDVGSAPWEIRKADVESVWNELEDGYRELAGSTASAAVTPS
jgi:hypothetical protein